MIPRRIADLDHQELEYILANRQPADLAGQAQVLTAGVMLHSHNVWLAMARSFCSNFTFFFCLTWQIPYLKEKYVLAAVAAGIVCEPASNQGSGLGNVVSGWVVDRIYRAGRWPLSRQAPAMVGFCLAAVGLVASRQMQTAADRNGLPGPRHFQRRHDPAALVVPVRGHRPRESGAVSGTMNMAGNLGSFLTALAFPYLLNWTGGPAAFFYVGAVMNTLAVGLWLLIHPDRKLEDW